MTTETTQDLAAKSGLAVTEIPRFTSFDVTVDVEIDADDLHSQGWHHGNECPAGPGPLAEEPSLADLRAVIAALHHQAHGSGSLVLCREPPCSSLSLDQLRGAA